jgi:acyl-CoA thioesterase FadM
MTYQLVHAMRMPIRWGGMDAMGHVKNTVYSH